VTGSAVDPGPGPLPVAVYGTLRRGGVRAIPVLFPGVEPVGVGTVEGVLHDFGAYPGFVTGAGRVVVELYEVDDAQLARLDDIERFRPDDPEGSYYRRVGCEVRLRPGTGSGGGSEGGSGGGSGGSAGDDTGVRRAWIYECNAAHFELGPVIASGDWMAHAARRVADDGSLPPEAWPDGAAIAR
jgi:gamma-glutamylcyclotransferase (GGCT)/AIG2-like uncharacterized protein YtfP